MEAFLAEAGVGRGALGAVVGRGGLLPPVPAGTFEVDAAMLADLERAERGEHASNLGAPLARAVADAHGGPAFVVDPVAVDELEPVARVTGLAGVERRSFTHALNIRAVARRHAAAVGQAARRTCAWWWPTSAPASRWRRCARAGWSTWSTRRTRGR